MLVLSALAGLALLYGFVCLVDPWDALPLSPRLPRVPISGNARFSFPALARDPRFDSVLLGTSTARLLQPAMLDPEFGARFANLSMNSATAFEQSEMLQVFLRAHPAPVAVLIGIDAAWCEPAPQRFTSRPFPEWMYRRTLWPGYSHMLTPYAVQEAANQFAVMLHLKRRRYGMDGYTRFVPPDSAYTVAGRDAAFARWPLPDPAPPAPGPAPEFPAMALLRADLVAIPGGTRVVLFFAPYQLEQQGVPGSATRLRWEACKRAVVQAAAATGTEVQDYLVPSDITRTRDNYWDPLHYRETVAARLARALAAGGGPDGVLLAPGPSR